MSHYGFNEDRSKVEIYSKDEVDELIEESGGGYTLPTMSASTKGGAKLGSGLSISEDTLSLSDEAYTSAEKTKLAGIEAGAQVNPSNASTSANGLMSSTDKAKLDGIETGAQAHKSPTSTEVTTALGFTPLDAATKGAASGVAELDSNGLVISSQLPSWVDDVMEYATLNDFPAIGETGKIYVATSTNITYRWSGSTYVAIGSDLALGETSSTAYRGDRGAAAYAHAVTNKGSQFASGLYKITTNSEGHVTDATAVAKSDITALGIPAQDTTYSAATSSADGLMSSTDKTNLDALVTWQQGLANADTSSY